jgi:peptidoglycan hydrolase-like protein with peptidoglycan-binding domain
MKQGEREQLLAMVTLLKDWGLAVHLRGKDFSKPDSWRPAVSRYNGKSYEATNYHVKAAAAFVKHEKGVDAKTGTSLPPKVVVPAGAVLIEAGMKGEAVRNLQADLAALGFKFTKGIDGRFGHETETHVRTFQLRAGLLSDGKVGDKTRKAIAAALEAQDRDLSPAAPEWQRTKSNPLLAALLAIFNAIFKR